MDIADARAIAERLHARERGPDGTPLLRHVLRVASTVPPEARALAWLHEALAGGAITEEALLRHGLTSDELRALRLVTIPALAPRPELYVAQVELIARAAGRAGAVARALTIADLEDRIRHSPGADGGWALAYRRALRRLRATYASRAASISASSPATPARAASGISAST
jgi:hypothetical protein